MKLHIVREVGSKRIIGLFWCSFPELSMLVDEEINPVCAGKQGTDYRRQRAIRSGRGRTLGDIYPKYRTKHVAPTSSDGTSEEKSQLRSGSR
jgi:hypothetical protein